MLFSDSFRETEEKNQNENSKMGEPLKKGE